MIKAPNELTPAELRRAVVLAIVREVGPVGLIRFLQDQSMGTGNYVEDRRQWLPEYESIEQLSADIDAWSKRRQDESGGV